MLARVCRLPRKFDEFQFRKLRICYFLLIILLKISLLPKYKVTKTRRSYRIGLGRNLQKKIRLYTQKNIFSLKLHVISRNKEKTKSGVQVETIFIAAAERLHDFSPWDFSPWDSLP